MKFDERALRDQLEPLARTKKVARRWDGLHYSKPVRGLGPDRRMLSLSAPVLKELMKVAPNGFPDLGCLRSVWMALDSEFDILECKARGQFLAAQSACDVWRKMARDCVDMKRSDATFADKALQEVVDLIKLGQSTHVDIPRLSDGFPDFDASDGDEGLRLVPSKGDYSHEGDDDDDDVSGDNDDEYRVLSSDNDSHDVEVVGAMCMCSKCAPIVAISDSENEGIVIPPPARGGQRPPKQRKLGAPSALVATPVARRRRKKNIESNTLVGFRPHSKSSSGTSQSTSASAT